MKILELSIKDIRGIREEIKLEPNGENFSVFGPNGTGKSAVVDAMDFLLTGNMSRLTGRGSQGMSMKEHGPHIDAEPVDAIVTAKIKVAGIKDDIQLSRCLLTPNKLECEPKIDNPILKEVLETAEKGQNVLSRAEILKFIAAEAGKRSEEIQAILDINKIEDIRKAFVTIKRDADKNLASCKANYETSVQTVSRLIASKSISDESILAKVNECRQILKGNILDKLIPGKLKDGITSKIEDGKKRIQPEQLKNIIAEIKSAIERDGKTIFEKERDLRSIVKQCKENEVLRKDLASKRLLDIGVTLIDDSGACPLCLKDWPSGELKEYLSKRLLNAQQATLLQNKITALSTEIKVSIAKFSSNVLSLVDAATIAGKTEIVSIFTQWVNNLKIWSDALSKAVDDYPTEEPNPNCQLFIAPDSMNVSIEEMDKLTKANPETDPLQKAWDMLTALDSVLERYLDEKNKFNIASRFAEKASLLETAFTATKDKVLEELYNSIKSDFITYYRFLHGIDEKTFQAEMKPSGAQLDFKVDFYGRGMHPPRALHSEGHQDSMGLCLFLALNKEICQGKVQFVILDDVVMSIDSEHRRSICRLLMKHFPDTQFLITTHNRTWARQLHSDGVVKNKNLIEFKSWSVENGPLYAGKTGTWKQIKECLEKNDVSRSAHLLREHLEFVFENICDGFKSQVPYKSDSRYEFGDYLGGAKNSYKSYLKDAKKAALSWNNSTLVDEFTKMESQFKEIVDRTQMENWAINANVHYNKWQDFSKEDLTPVIESFNDFEDLFRCEKCGGLLSVSFEGLSAKSVVCPCGLVNWNLEIKK